MRWSAPGALDADGEWLEAEGRAAGKAPEEVRRAYARRRREPDYLPESAGEDRIDRALAIACVTHALRRHCGNAQGPSTSPARALISSSAAPIFATCRS